MWLAVILLLPGAPCFFPHYHIPPQFELIIPILQMRTLRPKAPTWELVPSVSSLTLTSPAQSLVSQVRGQCLLVSAQGNPSSITAAPCQALPHLWPSLDLPKRLQASMPDLLAQESEERCVMWGLKSPSVFPGQGWLGQSYKVSRLTQCHTAPNRDWHSGPQAPREVLENERCRLCSGWAWALGTEEIWVQTWKLLWQSVS